MLPNFPFVWGTATSGHDSSDPPLSPVCSLSSVFRWSSVSVINNLKTVFDRLSMSEEHIEFSNVLPPMIERPDRPGEVTLPSLSELGLLSYGRPAYECEYPPRSPSLSRKYFDSFSTRFQSSMIIASFSDSDSDSDYERSLSESMEGLSLDDL